METTAHTYNMSGKIASVDPQARNLTIQSLVVKRTFAIAEDAAINTPAQPYAALKDLKVGDLVEVAYEQQAAGCLAHRIDDAGAMNYRKAA